MIRLFVSAGEPSGDAHAAAVVRALHREHADLDVEGIGGPEMAAAGTRLIGNIEHLSVMGLTEGIGTLPAHAQLLRTFRQRIATSAYDAVLLVDYPGFHLLLAGLLRRAVCPSCTTSHRRCGPGERGALPLSAAEYVTSQ